MNSQRTNSQKVEPLLMQKVTLLFLISFFICNTAVADARVRVTGWRVTVVNQEVHHTSANGSLRLCQAIPPVAIAPKLRWRGAPDDLRVRLRVTPTVHRPVSRTVILRRGAGRLAPVFTPATLRLRDEAFEAGAERLEVRRHGRVLARAALHFTAPGAGGTC